jgi:hypothetical protein
MAEAERLAGSVQLWAHADVATMAPAPVVEVTALRAQLASGDWLVLAEKIRPDLLPPPALPE